MAKTTPSAPVENETDEWETVQVGLGKEHDLEHEGPIVGTFVEMRTLEVEDKQNGGMRNANAYLIDTGEPRFIWAGYEIDQAFATGNDGRPIETGTRVRVEYLGESQFSSDTGPRRIKNYRVQIAKRT